MDTKHRSPEIDFNEPPITSKPEVDPAAQGPADTKAGSKKERASAATKLVEAVQCHGGVELFHDAQETYAVVDNGSHREVMAICSHAFRLFLVKLYYDLTAKIPHNQAVADAKALLEAKALFNGTNHKVYVRVAPGEGDEIFLDLGDELHSAVRLTASGWEVVSDPPVYFRRPDSMRALPVPERGGKLDDFANSSTWVRTRRLYC